LKSLLALALLLGTSPAFAVNKCTDSTGKVVFQDAPCPSGLQADEVKVWQNTPGASGGRSAEWQFLKATDQMTGKTSCKASSPVAYVPARRSSRDFNQMQLVVSAYGGGKFIAFVDLFSTSANILHNDVNGMGIRVEPGTFHPLNTRASQRIVATTESASLIDQLIQGKTFRLRMRFWPYDDLEDSRDIPLTGVRQAIAMAAECAKSL
jgi:hypothetical protein